MKYFSLSQQWVLFILAIFILGSLLFRFYYHPLPPSGKIDREIVVEILGEVRNPGIHLFQKPPTLKEAIEKAGGLKELALFDEESTSEILETGTLLKINKGIPREIKVKVERMEANKLLLFSIPLDINRVSPEDLCYVPEIGPSLARAIVAYRDRRKGFRSIEELKNVKGIGEKKYESIKAFFMVSPP
jgi:competence protein ComEA